MEYLTYDGDGNLVHSIPYQESKMIHGKCREVVPQGCVAVKLLDTEKRQFITVFVNSDDNKGQVPVDLDVSQLVSQSELDARTEEG